MLLMQKDFGLTKWQRGRSLTAIVEGGYHNRRIRDRGKAGVVDSSFMFFVRQEWQNISRWPLQIFPSDWVMLHEPSRNWIASKTESIASLDILLKAKQRVVLGRWTWGTFVSSIYGVRSSRAKKERRTGGKGKAGSGVRPAPDLINSGRPARHLAW